MLSFVWFLIKFEFNFRPLSMSENLTKMVQRIDFSKVENNEPLSGVESVNNKIDVNSDNEMDSKELATFQPSLWPWDSVRNKLKYLIVLY